MALGANSMVRALIACWETTPGHSTEQLEPSCATPGEDGEEIKLNINKSPQLQERGKAEKEHSAAPLILHAGTHILKDLLQPWRHHLPLANSTDRGLSNVHQGWEKHPQKHPQTQGSSQGTAEVLHVPNKLGNWELTDMKPQRQPQCTFPMPEKPV